MKITSLTLVARLAERYYNSLFPIVKPIRLNLIESMTINLLIPMLPIKPPSGNLNMRTD
ncbi:MAG: hypothetical protein WCE33_12865 [Nitrososphaeraceae archaeon]